MIPENAKKIIERGAISIKVKRAGMTQVLEFGAKKMRILYAEQGRNCLRKQALLQI